MKSLFTYGLEGKKVVEFEDLGVPVVYEKLKTTRGEIPRWAVFVKDEFHGVVSDDYTPVRTEDLVANIKRVSPIEIRTDTLNKRGRATVVTFPEYAKEETINPDELLQEAGVELDYEPTGNSKVEPMVIVHNSYNGMSPVDGSSGFYRLACSNGLVIGEEVSRVRFMHMIGRVEEVKQLQMQFEYFGKLVDRLMNPDLTITRQELEEISKKAGLGKRHFEKYVKPVVEKFEKIQLWVAVQLFGFMMMRIHRFLLDQRMRYSFARAMNYLVHKGG